MVSLFNLKSYLSNPSRIFDIEAMEAMLWLVKRVYFFNSRGRKLYKLRRTEYADYYWIGAQEKLDHDMKLHQ